MFFALQDRRCLENPVGPEVVSALVFDLARSFARNTISFLGPEQSESTQACAGTNEYRKITVDRSGE